MTLSRRHILGLAAGAAAGAALPAGAVAEAPLATPTIGEWIASKMELEFVEGTFKPTPFHNAVLKKMLAERGYPDVDVDAIGWTPFPPGIATKLLAEDAEDPVMHPEGREDPEEYA